MKGTLKQAMHRPYADQQIISVEVPEWPDDDGNPVTIRFATELNVDQVASVQASPNTCLLYTSPSPRD